MNLVDQYMKEKWRAVLENLDLFNTTFFFFSKIFWYLTYRTIKTSGKYSCRQLRTTRFREYSNAVKQNFRNNVTNTFHRKRKKNAAVVPINFLRNFITCPIILRHHIFAITIGQSSILLKVFKLSTCFRFLKTYLNDPQKL